MKKIIIPIINIFILASAMLLATAGSLNESNKWKLFYFLTFPILGLMLINCIREIELNKNHIIGNKQLFWVIQIIIASIFIGGLATKISF